MYVCAWVLCAYVRPSEFVWAITSTFMNELRNNLAQLFFLRSRSAVLNIYSGKQKVKVTLEGQ